MSCMCIRQAVYCLRLAEIPTDVYNRVECKCNNATLDTDVPYVNFFLCPDPVIWKTGDMTKWPVAYHGTAANIVGSILRHGQLLMRGDFLHDGSRIERRCGEENWHTAIWTNPQQLGAAFVATSAQFDNGNTEFKILIQLRHKPGTYTENPGLGFEGHMLWSTNRRGAIYLEALNVHVIKSLGASDPSPVLVQNDICYIKKFPCKIQREAFRLLKMLTVPKSLFDARHNICYCSECHPQAIRESLMANEKYTTPLGWVQFGLAINPVLEKINDIWKTWPVAFHGCHPDSVTSVIRSRALLIAGDITVDGIKLKSDFRADSIDNDCYFLSPEIGYASHPRYARLKLFTDTDGKPRCFQTVLLFKVRPKSFSKKEDTENVEVRLHQDYSIISEKEVEWFSKRRGCTHPIGLLVRKLEISNELDVQRNFVFPSEWDASSVFC